MSLPPPALRSLRQTWNTSLVFFREWIRSPRSIGMVCPSGTSLAKAMAAGVPKDTDGLVVELGAGTGTVTQELLRSGIHPQRLIIVEKSRRMAQLLQRRFPNLHVIQGDASNLPSYLPPEKRIDCIVSSLPLISLKEQTRRSLIQAMYTTLHDGGLLIQYTYSWRDSNIHLQKTFSCIGSKKVWNNVPPARIFRFVCKKNNNSGSPVRAL